jgi:hypothetical protein
MAWADVPAKLAQYDAEEYADNSNGTTASFKLLASFHVTAPEQILEGLRLEFEEQLDYRLGACINLRKSKGWHGKVLRQT